MDSLFTPGTFFLGTNYWASHAGTKMWREWNEKQIDDDMKRMKETGISWLRIFPLWSDFQPIRLHLGCQGAPHEVRLGEELRPFTEAGRAGVSQVMADRFERFMDLAQKNGLGLIVGLVSGWMSGRLHVPEMLQDKNVLTDAVALRWEIRYVTYMVKRFCKHPALLAWDLGNECNCMGDLKNSDQLYVWMSIIANTIRSQDKEHLVISGMHGIRPQTTFDPLDQGEVNDIVVTHPYPAFTPYCDTDPMMGMKSALHAVAESVMTAGLSGKPCFVEEMGTLGPMFISDENAADYLRNIMLGVWRHDCLGVMWWCAFDQKHLSQTPYDWNSIERELGIFAGDKKKPIAKVYKEMDDMLRRFPKGHLPERIHDAVCILSRSQDTWANAYGCFLLATQAKLDIQFAWAESEIPVASTYILPGVAGTSSLPLYQWQWLLDRVENHGATLLITEYNATMVPFEEFSGLHPMYRHKPTSPMHFEFEGKTFPYQVPYVVHMEPKSAEVLLSTDSGEVVLTRNAFGKGTVYYLSFPLEQMFGTTPGVVEGEMPWYRLYRFLNLRSKSHKFDVQDPLIGMTEHPDTNGTWVFLQNYHYEEQTIQLEGKGHITFLDSPQQKARAGAAPLQVVVPAHDGCLLFIEE